MSPQNHSGPTRSTALIATSVALVVAAAALLSRIGADAQWLAALGHDVMRGGSISGGVPFAAASTAHWPNVLVLAELAFNGLEQTLGDRGLMIAQLLAAGAAMAVVSRDALAGGARPVGACVALLMAGVGALPSLAIARVQLFSLLLFPVLVLLLRAEARRPTWRVWLVVPLLALWSNLHGAALVGLLVVLAYLILSRARRQPLLALAIGAASLAALCVTPALAGTVSYYHGVLTNVAAQRGQGMWGPLSLTAAQDLVLIVAAIVLMLELRRARPELWEVAVVAGLAALTVHASRSGVWLLLFLVPPAARAIRLTRTWERLVPLAAVASVAAIAFAVVRGPVLRGASHALVARAVALAHGTPVLAGDGIDEQVALDGGRIWVGNPIDAFTRRDQATYLDWVQGSPGGRGALSAAVRVVLVSRGSPAQTLMDATSSFSRVGSDSTTRIYERTG